MENVLIVEDSQMIVSALKQKLLRAGFNTYEACDIKQARIYIEEEFVDFFAVLLEIDLRSSESKESFVEYMISKRIATIILSSYCDSAFMEKMLKRDIVDYIAKTREEDLNYAVDMVKRISIYKDHKVLVVDDSKIAQKSARKNLEILKFKVLVAEDGLKALEIFGKHPEIKLIITDYNMPNMNGFDLVLSLRKYYTKEELIIIAVTAADDSKTVSMFLKYGANGCIAKKTTKEELNYTISNLMDVLKNKEDASTTKRQIEEYTNQLSKYVSPQIYSSIISGNGYANVATTDKKLSIFISDIAEFTKTTESLESEELTEMLNNYLTEMSNIALKWGATIDKFIGDAIMLFFGDPESCGIAEDAYRCVMMAIEMQKRMESFREEQKDAGVLLPFHIRCGIATGSVTVGNFGSHDRMDYTIIGRYVSLARELEAAAPVDEILISEETYLYVKNKIDALPSKKIIMREFTHDIQPYVITREKMYGKTQAVSKAEPKTVKKRVNKRKKLPYFDTKKPESDIHGTNDGGVKDEN